MSPNAFCNINYINPTVELYCEVREINKHSTNFDNLQSINRLKIENQQIFKKFLPRRYYGAKLEISI